MKVATFKNEIKRCKLLPILRINSSINQKFTWYKVETKMYDSVSVEAVSVSHLLKILITSVVLIVLGYIFVEYKK